MPFKRKQASGKMLIMKYLHANPVSFDWFDNQTVYIY